MTTTTTVTVVRRNRRLLMISKAFFSMEKLRSLLILATNIKQEQMNLVHPMSFKPTVDLVLPILIVSRITTPLSPQTATSSINQTRKSNSLSTSSAVSTFIRAGAGSVSRPSGRSLLSTSGSAPQPRTISYQTSSTAGGSGSLSSDFCSVKRPIPPVQRGERRRSLERFMTRLGVD